MYGSAGVTSYTTTNMAAPFNFYVCRRIPAIIKTPISLINLETNAAKISRQQITHARLYSSENQFRIPKNTWNFRSIKSSFRIAALVFGGGFVLRNLTKNWNGQKVYADADDNEELNRPDHTPSREVILYLINLYIIGLSSI